VPDWAVCGKPIKFLIFCNLSLNPEFPCLKNSSPELETLSDNALMQKVKEGDIDRLGLLFERYKKPLFGFFYGLNKDAGLSEDLVQNVFFRILKYRYLFRGEPAGRPGGGDFKTWMFHIARNVKNDHYRKENKLGKTDLRIRPIYHRLKNRIE
jgi:DNA-directed RNA polymerase specialized sigma24 family protein